MSERAKDFLVSRKWKERLRIFLYYGKNKASLYSESLLDGSSALCDYDQTQGSAWSDNTLAKIETVKAVISLQLLVS